MTSLRHKVSADDLALDAAREVLLAVGWSRTTLTEIARRAGVSRMTLYRRWPDMGSLLADLMTREWAALVDVGDADSGDVLEPLVAGVVSTARAVRENALFARIVELDADLLLPYLLERPGRSQTLVLEVLRARILAGQERGEIRAGDPRLLARSVLLAAHGFTLSVHTMTGPGLDEDAFAAELGAPGARVPGPMSRIVAGTRGIPETHRRARGRPRRDRRRRGARRSQPRSGRGGRRRLRRRLGNVAVELEAGPRRAALPRPRASSRSPTRARSSAAS